MKISLQDLKIKVKAKADTFGKYSPADINCDELLWLIAQLEAAQQGVQSDVCPSCGVDDWAYGDDTNTFEVCAMCGKRR